MRGGAWLLDFVAVVIEFVFVGVIWRGCVVERGLCVFLVRDHEQFFDLM